MKSLAALLALAAAIVALSGCGSGEYCVSPRSGAQLCGAAARAWCDDHAVGNPGTSDTATAALDSVDAACARVGGV